MKRHSPAGHIEQHDTKIHQKGMHDKSPSAVEPHPKGGSVDNDGANQRHGKVGVMPPTIGPRAA